MLRSLLKGPDAKAIRSDFRACIVYSVAWFLPVIMGGVTFPRGLPGWQAFRAAACAVWPYDRCKFDDWYAATLSTISAATTLLFIPASIWAVSRGSRSLRRAFAWVAISAFVVNAHWYVLFVPDRRDLRIVYAASVADVYFIICSATFAG